MKAATIETTPAAMNIYLRGAMGLCPDGVATQGPSCPDLYKEIALGVAEETGS
jgi:hypothetical protein